VSTLADVRRNYRAAFLQYLPRREEAALAKAYEIGRSAVADGVSLLELAQIHHDVLLEVLRSSRPEQLPGIADAASELLLEVLAPYHMTQRDLP
jgi:hypothetical protein